MGYYLASDTQKEALLLLFKILADNIAELAPHPERKQIYAKTLHGLYESIAIEKWVDEKIPELSRCSDHENLLMCIWPLFKNYSKNKAFQSCTSETVLKNIAIGWIHGKSFENLFEYFEADTRIGRYRPKFDHVVDICENGLGFDGTLIIAGIIEVANLLATDAPWIESLRLLQKKLKYGVSSEAAVRLHELGFSDRVIAEEMSLSIRSSISSRYKLVSALNDQHEEFMDILSKFPEYYSRKLDDFVFI